MLTDTEREAVYGPREWVASCWCAHFRRCDGLNVPGYRGGGRAELCERCESAEDAARERANGRCEQTGGVA